MLTSNICVGAFSGIVEARILKLCIQMDSEWLYCWIENQTQCLYSSLYLSIICPLRLNLRQFSQELCKVESLNMVYICRMSDCIVGLRLRAMTLILLFSSIFLSFPILHVNIKNLRQSF